MDRCRLHPLGVRVLGETDRFGTVNRSINVYINPRNRSRSLVYTRLKNGSRTVPRVASLHALKVCNMYCMLMLVPMRTKSTYLPAITCAIVMLF